MQTYEPIEIIVVDDCSSDDISAVIASYAGYAGSISLKYIRLERNGGGSSARNAGIRAAVGDYVAFLDSDDEWHPEHLRILMDATERQSGHFVVASSAMKARNKNRPLPGKEYPGSRSVAEKLHFVLSAELAFQTSTLLMPRRTARQFMFDPLLRRHQDWDLICRLIEKNVLMVLLPTATAIYHPPNASSTSLTRSERPSMRFLVKHRRVMSQKTVARFVALEIMRRRPVGFRMLKLLAYATVLGGISLKEFLYYIQEMPVRCWLHVADGQRVDTSEHRQG